MSRPRPRSTSLASYLLVDDHRESLNSLALHFGTRGITVYKAQSTEEAKDIIRSTILGAVITPGVGPGINGAEILGELKTRHPFSVGVIIVEQGDTATALKALRAGIHEAVQAPITSPDLLSERISKHIDNQRARRELAKFNDRLADFQKDIANRDTALEQKSAEVNSLRKMMSGKADALSKNMRVAVANKLADMVSEVEQSAVAGVDPTSMKILARLSVQLESLRKALLEGG